MPAGVTLLPKDELMTLKLSRFPIISKQAPGKGLYGFQKLAKEKMYNSIQFFWMLLKKAPRFHSPQYERQVTVAKIHNC